MRSKIKIGCTLCNTRIYINVNQVRKFQCGFGYGQCDPSSYIICSSSIEMYIAVHEAAAAGSFHPSYQSICECEYTLTESMVYIHKTSVAFCKTIISLIISKVFNVMFIRYTWNEIRHGRSLIASSSVWASLNLCYTQIWYTHTHGVYDLAIHHLKAYRYSRTRGVVVLLFF